MTHLKTNTPDSLQYLVEDYFEKVVFYDNQLQNTAIKALDNGQYQLDVDFSVRKYSEEADNLPLADYIEIGVYDEKEELLHLEQVKVTQLDNQLQLVLEQKPEKVVLDPRLLLVDRELED